MEHSVKVVRNESTTLPIRDAKVRGLAFEAMLRVNPNSGLPDGYYGGYRALGINIGVVDLSKVNVRFRLKRQNQKHPEDIINCRLDSLLCSTNGDSVQYESIRYGRNIVWTDDEFTEAVICANLILPTGIIDVQKGDELDVIVHIASNDWLTDANHGGYGGAAGQKLADLNNSYIRVRAIEAHEHETQRVIPICKEYNFPYNQDSTKQYLGDNVESIHFYTERPRYFEVGNPAYIPYQYSLQTKFKVIESADIQSNQFSVALDDQDIFRNHMELHESLTQASKHHGHYVLYQGEELDDCSINVRVRDEGLDSNDEARLVVWSFKTDKKQFDKAMAKEKQVAQYQLDKVKSGA